MDYPGSSGTRQHKGGTEREARDNGENSLVVTKKEIQKASSSFLAKTTQFELIALFWKEGRVNRKEAQTPIQRLCKAS